MLDYFFNRLFAETALVVCADKKPGQIKTDDEGLTCVPYEDTQ